MAENEIAFIVREEIAKIARLSSEEIADDSDLFSLGFHSVTIVALIARIAHRTGIELRPRDLWEAPTVGMISNRVRELSNA